MMQWCVDCTEWQIRSENGEALPPPGGQLSIEETARPPSPAQLPDTMVFEADVANSDEVDVTRTLAFAFRLFANCRTVLL